jgi:O-methyltransferase
MLNLIAGPKMKALLAELRAVRDVPGVVVELGVYQGGSLAAMADAWPDRVFYGFDTFKGMPAEGWRDGEPHGIGDFGDTSFSAVRRALKTHPNVVLVKGLFPASVPPGCDAVSIALAHVDMDWFTSTRDAIAWLLPRMSPGGSIVFDDYDWKHCPGVRQAIGAAGLEVEVTTPHQAVYRVPR